MWGAWELAKLLWEQLDDTRRWPKEKRLRAVLRWWSAKASGSPLAWEEHDGTGGDGGPTVRPVYNLMRELRLKHNADWIDYGENVQGEEARAALASYLDAALASDQLPPPPPVPRPVIHSMVINQADGRTSPRLTPEQQVEYFRRYERVFGAGMRPLPAEQPAVDQRCEHTDCRSGCAAMDECFADWDRAQCDAERGQWCGDNESGEPEQEPQNEPQPSEP